MTIAVRSVTVGSGELQFGQSGSRGRAEDRRSVGGRSIGHDYPTITKVCGDASSSQIACPPRETLIALAARSLALGHPAFEHLSKSSPCYRQFRALQEGRLSRPETSAPSVPKGAYQLAIRREGDDWRMFLQR